MSEKEKSSILTLEIHGTAMSGKTFLLNKIKEFLEREGFSVRFSENYEHSLVIVNKFNIDPVKK